MSSHSSSSEDDVTSFMAAATYHLPDQPDPPVSDMPEVAVQDDAADAEEFPDDDSDDMSEVTDPNWQDSIIFSSSHTSTEHSKHASPPPPNSLNLAN